MIRAHPSNTVAPASGGQRRSRIVAAYTVVAARVTGLFRGKSSKQSACRASQQTWELSPEGEANMLKVLDPTSDAGRPTAPSQAVPQVDLDTIHRQRNARQTSHS